MTHRLANWKPDVDKHKTHHSTASLSRVLQYGDIDLPFIDECWQKDAAHLFCALHGSNLCASFDCLSLITELDKSFDGKHSKRENLTCGCLPCGNFRKTKS
ncbi:hypothetical protein CSKR_103870 [Clonorchis sinensis]|uniref:Uncharacterized protein n=1 Tax=Clonorchis sinensis TaxID=79923 RepID=A0A8T1MB46_CLOSI|nr:hypothetical protein CSKR_103870 [Clonorchis sinensis]